MNNVASIDWQEPFWLTLAASGITSNVATLNLGLKRLFKQSLSSSDRLFEAAEAGLGKMRGERFFWHPEPLHRATLTIVASTQAQLIGKAHYPFRDLKFEDYANFVRWQAYLNKAEAFEEVFRYAEGWTEPFDFVDVEWLQSRQPDIQGRIMSHVVEQALRRGDVPPGFAELCDRWIYSAACLAIARGDASKVGALAAEKKALQDVGFGEAALFLEGRVEEAYAGFQKRCGKKKNSPLFSFPSLFARLAALRTGDYAAAFSPRFGSSPYWGADVNLHHVASCLASPEPKWNSLILDPRDLGVPLCVVTALEPLFPADLRLNRRALRAEALARAESQGLAGFAEQLREGVSSPRRWGHGLQQQEPWEIALQTLRTQGLKSAPVAEKTVQAEERLAWRLSDPPEAFRQKLTKKGWSGKTKVSPATLMQKPPDYISEQDRVALSRVQTRHAYMNPWSTQKSTEYTFGAAFWRALVGHPNLYHFDEPAQLVEVPLRIKVTRSKEMLELQTDPQFFERQTYVLSMQPDGIVALCAPDPQLLQLVEMLRTPLKVPEAGRERIFEGLEPWLDRVELRYDDNVEPLVASEAGDPTLRVQLQPFKQGLRATLRVRPLGEEGPLFRPGVGPAQESLRWKNRPLLVTRDLAKELQHREQLLAACPALYDGDDQEFPELEEALEALLQLQNCGVPLDWEAKPWKVRGSATGRQLNLRADSAQSWFEVRGELRVDETLVLGLGRLLEIHRDSSGRFLRLDDGQFLALTQELRDRLEALDELVEPHRKELRLSPLAVPTLAELEPKLEADAAFRKTLARFQEAEGYRARIPAGLQAELRDYQLDGFRWMAQRVRAGAGVCLADDMGLGKTVQTIALLLKESAKGPQLVLCPTSVTSNWFDQITRFAPDLRPLYWEGKNRVPLAELGPRDVLLCSYRMLLQDRVGLTKAGWRSVVLDEAQYIKNPESKTARAAFELQAEVRIATTGTPIENRLSELWSIFRFLNPGLLGTLPSFRNRFEAPVLAGHAGPRQRLRRLVSPFLLRRTKHQVATELPPRTEIAITVDFSEDERALYEDTRRNALASVSTSSGQLQILAFLTKLRQACCHPQLLLPAEKFTSSKFEAFFNLAADLLAGNHRALVFSQFTSLLKLLEAELVERGMSHLYLDGSTPAASRRQLVDSFQEGEADFFLISLKAGGTGLNLTGADYVIHLDPWWNPAAEDQASDRAHRIGQTRPVTIYRLIARDTIEEKVVKLHEFKRELAQGVLEGADGQSKLSSEELFELLQ